MSVIVASGKIYNSCFRRPLESANRFNFRPTTQKSHPTLQIPTCCGSAAGGIVSRGVTGAAGATCSARNAGAGDAAAAGRDSCTWQGPCSILRRHEVITIITIVFTTIIIISIIIITTTIIVITIFITIITITTMGSCGNMSGTRLDQP